MSNIIAVANMQEYFYTALQQAICNRRVAVSQEAQAYVVQLLCTFSRCECAYAGTEYNEQFAAATLLQRAQNADAPEAMHTFKHVGDSCLYIAGLFEESLTRRGLTRSYYVDIGELAYYHLSALLSQKTASTAGLYQQLSRQFPQLVHALDALGGNDEPLLSTA
ncbi:MAG: hypothetical protein AAF310_05350 [Myxococcota bacterium]